MWTFLTSYFTILFVELLCPISAIQLQNPRSHLDYPAERSPRNFLLQLKLKNSTKCGTAVETLENMLEKKKNKLILIPHVEHVFCWYMNVRASVYLQELKRSYRTEFGTMDPFGHFCGQSGRAASTPQPFHHCKEGKDRVSEPEPSDLNCFRSWFSF